MRRCAHAPSKEIHSGGAREIKRTLKKEEGRQGKRGILEVAGLGC